MFVRQLARCCVLGLRSLFSLADWSVCLVVFLGILLCLSICVFAFVSLCLVFSVTVVWASPSVVGHSLPALIIHILCLYIPYSDRFTPFLCLFR